ncbi:hypothetical protein AMS68_004922 [Peltaster fructicola]|uniref:Formin GTPase-binding domain-containing protein n=1 Tax=Peltaster fructicola TaxID=286661 RepID=A0A6H0XXL9_9PEZI|nr:hypothetical protein AMS68_004922 [Peltaster fructicola]
MASSVPKLEQPLPQRPQHQRKQSSKSILFKALVSPVKGKAKETGHDRTAHPEDWSGKKLDDISSRALGERTSNRRPAARARSVGVSSTRRDRDMRQTDTPKDVTEDLAVRTGSPMKKSMKQPKDKENTTPRSSIEEGSHIFQVTDMTTRKDRALDPRMTPRASTNISPRKISDSSTDSISPRKALSIMKRGARVMAAVAAIQGKSVPVTPVQELEQLSPTDVEARFEAMLSNRNVPPAMREKMRNLTLRMKADLVKQEQDVLQASETRSSSEQENVHGDNNLDDEGKSIKRSRPRSRTFTFSRSDRHADDSPSKKQRGRSRSRPAAVKTTEDTSTTTQQVPSTPRRSSARGSKTENPADYIAYLTREQDPTKIEVGRLHKLRILLRNETVAWVDSFVALNGLTQITSLLYRIMAIEWREEHEDQLLHETLLCLKGLCTTESALSEVGKLADDLFPALLAMLFDEERKGPAEYTTRAIIINVLFAYLSARTVSTPTSLEERARKVLSYLSKPKKNDDSQPLDFVVDMQLSRPYKLWCKEITNVTREVFWIFLHQLNVIPTQKSMSDTASTFAARHFPGVRPPVPAAPYIGGVEWDATTYITGHLDLLNGLIASLPTRQARNELRRELEASGFEKTMGTTLRTCKEKFYAGVHDGLQAWVSAAVEDEWPVLYVCEGPTLEEQAKSARTSPKKSKQAPPKLDEIKLDAPKLDLNLGFTNNDDNGWLDA